MLKFDCRYLGIFQCATLINFYIVLIGDEIDINTEIEIKSVKTNKQKK